MDKGYEDICHSKLIDICLLKTGWLLNRKWNAYKMPIAFYLKPNENVITEKLYISNFQHSIAKKQSYIVWK